MVDVFTQGLLSAGKLRPELPDTLPDIKDFMKLCGEEGKPPQLWPLLMLLRSSLLTLY